MQQMTLSIGSKTNKTKILLSLLLFNTKPFQFIRHTVNVSGIWIPMRASVSCSLVVDAIPYHLIILTSSDTRANDKQQLSFYN